MIALDTNLLVYAHRPEMPFHERARQVLTEAVAAPEPVCVPWPCAHEFLAVVSDPRIFRDPTPMDVALDAVRRLLASLAGASPPESDNRSMFRAGWGHHPPSPHHGCPNPADPGPGTMRCDPPRRPRSLASAGRTPASGGPPRVEGTSASYRLCFHHNPLTHGDRVGKRGTCRLVGARGRRLEWVERGQ